MNEPTEVERLRARVAELEAQVATTEIPAAETGPRRRSVWWAVASGILVLLACILAPLSVTSVWASTELSNTDRYVQTVAPIADDPAVQAALANRVTTVIFENIDVKGIATDALDALAQRPNLPPRVADALPTLAVPIANGVRSFTRSQVDKFFASPAFPKIWDQVNRAAHTQVTKLLEGNQGGAVSAQGNTITVNLGPIVAQVKNRLVAQGFGLASNIPAVDASFVLVQSDAITSAQGFYRLLNTLGAWLPLIALALFVGGVLLARDRRRALLRGAVGVAAAMIVLGIAIALARLWYVGATPGNVLTEQSAGNVFDTLVRFLRSALRATAVLALVVALAAFLTGPSAAAVRIRSALEHGIGSARGGAESVGWNTGAVGTWTYAHKRALRIGTVIAFGLVLVFWTQPTGWVVLGITLVALAVLALIEFLGRPPALPAAVPTSAPGGPALPRQMPSSAAETTAQPPAPEAALQPSSKGTEPHV